MGQDFKILLTRCSPREANQRATTLSSAKLKQSPTNTAIAKCLIIKCNLPLSLVENVAFREFMKECDIKWSPISSKKFRQDPIAASKEEVNTFIREALDSVDHGKVYRVVTDNASNMVKAYKFGLSVDDDMDTDGVESSIEMAPNTGMDALDGK